MKQRIKPWMVVLVAGLAYVGITLARYDGDPLAFALTGSRYSHHEPQGTEGYDGQFAYYVARDPLDGWQHCDVPAYRYQRILYPVMAWALALGRPAGVPWTLILINLAAVAGGTYFTERLLDRHGVSRWYALAYGLYGGLVAGLRLNLTEPLAYGLVQGGLWSWVENRKVRAASFFALGALAKETALIAVGGLLVYLLLESRWRETALLGLATLLPFGAWQGVLWTWLGSPGVGSGGAMATAFEWLPFGGLLRATATSWPVFWLLLAVEGPLFVLPTVWGVVTSGRDLLRGRRHLWTVQLLVQAAVLPFLPFSTWREPLAMTRLATGLVTATLLYGALHHSRRVLTLSFTWLATLALLVNESQLPI
ncbi:MAG: hypothetical protein U9R72_17320 [Chloroflexota bacterium]|nr:hypothetical protein [Chloroflexota bacterium]